MGLMDELAKQYPNIGGATLALAASQIPELREQMRRAAEFEVEYIRREVRAKGLAECYPGVDWHVFMDERTAQQGLAGTFKP